MVSIKIIISVIAAALATCIAIPFIKFIVSGEKLVKVEVPKRQALYIESPMVAPYSPPPPRRFSYPEPPPPHRKVPANLPPLTRIEGPPVVKPRPYGA